MKTNRLPQLFLSLAASLWLLVGCTVVVVVPPAATATPSPTSPSTPVPATPATPPATPPAPTPVAPTPVPKVSITRDQAIAVARSAALTHKDAPVISAEQGRFADVAIGPGPDSTAPIAPDRPVWRVDLGTTCGPLCGSGDTVIVDAVDGRVLESSSWIS